MRDSSRVILGWFWMPIWIVESGVERDLIPFWIFSWGTGRIFLSFRVCELGTVASGEANTVSGAVDSEFKARQERFLPSDSGVVLPIHLGRGC